MHTVNVFKPGGYRYLKALLIALPKAKTAGDYEALLPWHLVKDDR